MSFTTPNTAGGTVTLRNGDKITFAGEELIINGIGPYGVGLRTRRPPPAAVACTANLFTQLNGTTLAPEYGSSLSIRAQFKADTTEEENLWEDDDGPDIPHTRKVAYLQEGNASADWPHVRVVLRDKVRGLMFGGLYTVKLIPVPVVTTAGNANAGIAAKTTPGTPVTLTAKKVDLREKIQLVDNQQIKRGDACVIVEKSNLTYATLMTAGIFFEITIPGGTVLRYQLPSKASDAIESLQSHHWKLYLNRVRP